VEGKSFAFERLQVVRFDYFPWVVLHSELGAIEMIEAKVDSSQSVNQCDSLLHEQVGAFSLVFLVRLFQADYNNITSLSARVLIGFTVESVWVLIWCALINVDFNDLLFFDNFLSIASLAFVGFVNDFTLAATFVAWALRLCIHAWAELSHLRDHSASFASWTLLDCTFLAT